MTGLAPERGAGLRLQPLTRARVASLGAAGEAWFDGLPTTLAALCDRWGLEVVGSMPGGSASYVARVRTREGSGRVLKIGTPDVDLAAEARLLGAAGGRGHVALHAVDAERNAVLLEELGASLEQTPMPIDAQVRLLAATLREAWLPPEGPWRVRRGDTSPAVRLSHQVRARWEDLGRPCSAAALEAALEAADRRAAAHAPERCVVVHGDPHPANLLRAREAREHPGTGWAFVDGDGFAAEPEYDLGVANREWTAALAAVDDPVATLRHWCAIAAEETGTDAGAVWDWALLERVSTGLYVVGFGAERIGRALLASADRLVGAVPPAGVEGEVGAPVPAAGQVSTVVPRG